MTHNKDFYSDTILILYDFRLLPQCKRDLCFSVMLCTLDWWLVTDVLG